LLDGQVEAVAGFGAQGRERAGNVIRDADLDRIGMRQCRNQRGGGNEGSDETHGGVLRARAAQRVFFWDCDSKDFYARPAGPFRRRVRPAPAAADPVVRQGENWRGS